MSQTPGMQVESPEPNVITREVKALRTEKDSLVSQLNASGTRVVAIPLNSLRIHDLVKDALPDAAGTDDMGLADAVGSAAVGVITADDSQLGYALFMFQVPGDYKTGSDLSIILRAKTTGLGQVTNQFDIEAKLVGDAAVGSDICATGPATVTTSYANYSFTITGATLAPGDVLQVRIKYAMDDTGGGGAAGVATLARVQVQYPIYVLPGGAGAVS